ncbi:hypothetical protein [Lapidilactobacillus wuchangensis]|uniref:hypothetical protein n=1 Tax=Lapidilactobacillus wuchangensis TaxID=2486001 RepID=UPI0013DE2C78|nr:hypothetical protein [Lapidilactobacillus wuchangensis]
MMTMMDSYSWGGMIFWSVLLLVVIVLLVIAVAYLLWKVNHLNNQIVELENQQRHPDH